MQFRCVLAESEELHIERFTLAVALNNEEKEGEEEELKEEYQEDLEQEQQPEVEIEL
jgi:hypothetical protein